MVHHHGYPDEAPAPPDSWPDDPTSGHRHAVPIPRYPEPDRLYEAVGQAATGVTPPAGMSPPTGMPSPSAVDALSAPLAHLTAAAPHPGSHAPPASSAPAPPQVRHATEPLDVDPAPRYEPVADNVYGPRRPGVFAVLLLVVIPLLLPALVVLGRSAFGDLINPGGVVAATLTIIGLPLLAYGLYPLLRGHRPTLERASVQVLRPPFLWVGVALTLLAAAALAAS